MDEFRPDRYSRGEAEPLFPFGNGPRVCIGRTLAGLKMQAFVVALVRRFKLEAASAPKPIGVCLIAARSGRGREVDAAGRLNSLAIQHWAAHAIGSATRTCEEPRALAGAKSNGLDRWTSRKAILSRSSFGRTPVIIGPAPPSDPVRPMDAIRQIEQTKERVR
ncbi:cytochrome P450 [Bradyrhizobium sp. USDA 4508]